MMFIPFVENAFKHGLKTVKAPGIKIKLICEPNRVNFEVVNHADETKTINKDRTQGIGLANTRRRLELLYPERHEMSVLNENGYYTSKLTIFYHKQ